ncbi:hypothetical protein [Peribacillus loiseleuriae]|uniref:Uncharacterized protein n=1 Tax=Peribacillus loiseleuriae TaxID=1679170 RepID=A0A0K9G960_9BACI|nr:hypothetical protein [Peribacillus loiseleuriae]KMY42777.1 hypothetical protein AC625_24290 [Peribacillus loiseleuriae]
MSKGKMVPGKGFQYTPKTTIEWADEFNELLNNYSSRNELMSTLLEDGLRVRNGLYKENGIFIPMGTFTNDQLALLKTEEGKRILYNVVSLMLGNPESATFVHQMVQPTSSEIKPVSRQIKSTDVIKDGEIAEEANKGVTETNEALSKLLKLGRMTNLKG